MIRNRSIAGPLLLLLQALLIQPPAGAEESPPWTLEALMHSLATVEERQVRFTEIRQLSLLQQELTQQGRLSFRRPDLLIKEFDPPAGVRYRIDANRLQISRQDGSEEIIRLDNAPGLLAYVAAMRSVLAGDQERLLSYFELQLEGDHRAWHLLLKPKEPGLARQVRRVEISGSDNEIEQFLILEQGGDRITTRLWKSHAP